MGLSILQHLPTGLSPLVDRQFFWKHTKLLWFSHLVLTGAPDEGSSAPASTNHSPTLVELKARV